MARKASCVFRKSRLYVLFCNRTWTLSSGHLKWGGMIWLSRERYWFCSDKLFPLIRGLAEYDLNTMYQHNTYRVASVAPAKLKALHALQSTLDIRTSLAGSKDGFHVENRLTWEWLPKKAARACLGVVSNEMLLELSEHPRNFLYLQLGCCYWSRIKRLLVKHSKHDWASRCAHNQRGKKASIKMNKTLVLQLN